MAPLSEERLSVFARALANVPSADCRAAFDVLAAAEEVTNAEMDAEFQRLHITMLRYRPQQGCIRSGVHRHYMSCAQEAMWHRRTY